MQSHEAHRVLRGKLKALDEMQFAVGPGTRSEPVEPHQTPALESPQCERERPEDRANDRQLFENFQAIPQSGSW